MIDRMKAFVLEDVATLRLKEFPLPEIGPKEVLYQVKACSLCTVEQRAYSGKKHFGFPFVGGHETAGVVLAVGAEVKEYLVGDHVVSTFNYCGECDFCKTGQGTQCQNGYASKPRFPFEGTIIGGGMAQYLAVQTQQLVKVSKAIPFEEMALTEPLACCIHSVEKAKLKFGDTVVIIGAGIMGLLNSQLCQLQGARVIISEPDEQRRDKALALGAHLVIDPNKEELVERVKEVTAGRGAEVVINTIPLANAWLDGMNALAPYGRLIAYSAQDSKEKIPVDFGHLHNKEYEYIGTVSPTIENNLRATRLIGEKIIDMTPYIEKMYDYCETAKAFEHAVQPNTYRVVLHHYETVKVEK
ncbi:alcohol dehydrogenase catalytic domain-containing protein [Vagococcus sp. BWB3-3]|uniref:Alcohol dehydrogenase catalytic domain-containing protein n=1 Tax=Vagococcus allomyrinae TaxID=2794353 RepID=A0A940P6I7_9ENTE|nr:alcohol dehydrogenase catalytic domain-containing protein [Vagococcus allomyrinae]MBP1042544.1 alcohol dehydrogenase catalytic domain-containing protein [Vagococcus allomyrinae]